MAMDQNYINYFQSPWDSHDRVTPLRDVTCHMGSHSIACYLTQVNAGGRHCKNCTQFIIPTLRGVD